MDLCGMFPAEYYELPYGEIEFFDKSVFVTLLVIALVMIAVYLLCWILSKKNRVGWLIFALVWFGIDSAFLLMMMGGDIANFILDIVFHVWVIISLINGIRSYYKLQNLPEEDPPAWDFAQERPMEEIVQPSETTEEL